MALHGVEEGFHKKATQKDLYALIQKADRILSF